MFVDVKGREKNVGVTGNLAGEGLAASGDGKKIRGLTDVLAGERQLVFHLKKA